MARIRSIKPEFWTSEQVLECSTNARLLFIGLWNFCDDAGRHPYSAKQAKAEIFPADDFTEADVSRMLDELSSNGLIMRYATDSKEYFYVTGWKHQRIDKPQSPKYPEPVVDHSTNDPRTLPPDTIGKDRKGREEDAAPAARDHEVELYRRGKEILGDKSGGLIAKLVKTNNGSIAKARAALETASTKADPREYIGAVVRGRDSPEDLRARGEAW